MRHSVAKLSDVERGLPTLDESAACAQAMKAALFEGVKAADMTAIMAKTVQQAKDGDLKAVKLLIEFVSKTAPSQHLSVGVRVNQAGHVPGSEQPRLLPASGSPQALERPAARLLGKLGPTPAADLAELLGVTEGTVDGALESSPAWFQLLPDGWRLTATGRQDLLPRKEV